MRLLAMFMHMRSVKDWRLLVGSRQPGQVFVELLGAGYQKHERGNAAENADPGQMPSSAGSGCAAAQSPGPQAGVADYEKPRQPLPCTAAAAIDAAVAAHQIDAIAAP